MLRRVVVFGDSHGTLPMVREAAHLAALLDAEAIMSVGDFGIWPGSGGKEFLDISAKIAAARGVEIVVTPGNHDDYDQLERAPRDGTGRIVLRDNVHAVERGAVIELAGLRWLCLSGAASIDGPGGPWRPQNRGPLDETTDIRNGHGRIVTRKAGYDLGGWWPQERITPADAAAAVAAAERHGPVAVMISHEAPNEIELTGELHKPTAWAPNVEQRDLVSTVHAAARPPVHLCGHWHVHREQRDTDRYLATLAADVTPDQRQWVLIETDGSLLRVLAPRVWGLEVSLTAPRPRGFGAPRNRHRVVSDLTDDDLGVVFEAPVPGR